MFKTNKWIKILDIICEIENKIMSYLLARIG
jgi:hypothetical protein